MIYVFGDFELSTKRYELCRNGRSMPLRPKSLDVLVYLIRHHSRMVTHDELIWHIWGVEGTEFFSTTSLANCIKEIRSAIGDDGRTQHSIKTIHGRGYRFEVAVSEHIEELSQSQKPPLGDYSAKVIEEKVFTVGMDFVDALERYKHTLYEGVPDEGLSPEFHTLLIKIERLIGPLTSEDTNTARTNIMTR